MGFLWNEKYSIGIREIDEQHQKLLQLLNNAKEAYSSDADCIVDEENRMKVYMDILKLREYALTHLATEEKYMAKHRYPDFLKHKGTHDAFIMNIFKLENRLLHENDMTPSDLINFVLEWFRDHESRVDRKFGEYLRNQRCL